MISYANQDLFYQDSIEKQMSITYSGGSITNANLREEDFELEEILNSSEDLNFGECNASKISFSVGYYKTSLVGKELTVKITPSGGSEFQIGKYTVISDNPNDKRSVRKVVAYDKLYEILKKDVTSWYNTLLPNESTTKTLKQFRDSFFTFVGVTQKTQTLPNDNMTVKRTHDPTALTGKTVINKICEINGCFGRINRSGNFEYVFLEEPGQGLFPSNTLYPADNLYPVRYGMSRTYTYVYERLKYEDYLVKPINKLIFKDSNGDTQVSFGNGTNEYIVSDNFLLFDKTNQELGTIGDNMFPKISNRWYRPVEIDTLGDPCLETGDGIRLFTVDNVEINTYVLKRVLHGIQSLKDTFESDGLEYRANDRNGISDQIVQIKDNIRKVEADYVKTTTLEANYITAQQISAVYATIDNLNAVSLRVGNIEADYVTANQLSAVDAKFENLNASKITSGNMSGSYISAGTINADRLNVNSFRSSQLDCAHLNSINSFIYFGGYQFTIAYAGNGHWDFTSDRPPT